MFEPVRDSGKEPLLCRHMNQFVSPRLKFSIDNPYLVAHLLARVEASRAEGYRRQGEVNDFYETAKGISPELTRQVAAHEWSFLSPLPEGATEEKIREWQFICQLIQHPFFPVVREQTELRLATVQRQWEESLKITTDFVSSLTGLPFDREITVLITHPQLGQGRALADGRILWGGQERWDNYSIVYLWHEILHWNLGRSDTSHAIIELIADNALRAKLNNCPYPPFEGHPQLDFLREAILPHWKRYIGSCSRNIYCFEQQMIDLFGNSCDRL